MWWWAALTWAGSDEVLGDLDRYRVSGAWKEPELQEAARTRAAVERLKLTPAARDAEAAWRVARNGGDPRSVARWLAALSNRDASPATRRDAAARAARLAPIAEKLASEYHRFQEAQRLVGLHQFAAARDRLDPLRALVPEDPEIDWWIGESWLGEALGADATVDMDTPTSALLGWSIAIPTPGPGLAPERALSLADDAFGRAAHVAPGWIRARISGFEVKVAMARRDPGRLPELLPPARAIEANAGRWAADDRRDAARALGLYRHFGGGPTADRAARAAASFDVAAGLGDPISAWNAAIVRANADPTGWATARATTPLLPGALTWWVAPGGDLGTIAGRLDDGFSAFVLGSGPSVLVVDREAYVWTPEPPVREATVAVVSQPRTSRGDASNIRPVEPSDEVALLDEEAEREDRPRPSVDAARALQSAPASTSTEIAFSKRKSPRPGTRAEVAIPRPAPIALATPFHAQPLLTSGEKAVAVSRRAVCDRAHCTSIVVVSASSE